MPRCSRYTFLTSFGVVYREVWVPDASIAARERLLVGIDDIKPVKQVCDYHL